MTLNELIGTASKAELPDLVVRLRALAMSLEKAAYSGFSNEEAHVAITDWVIAKRAVPILVGTMNGHPTVRDGRVGATTEIYYVDQQAGLVRTFNRWYRLGRPMSAAAGLLQ